MSEKFNDFTLKLNTLTLTFHKHSQYKCIDIYNKYTLTLDRLAVCMWTYASVVGHFGTVTQLSEHNCTQDRDVARSETEIGILVFSLYTAANILYNLSS